MLQKTHRLIAKYVVDSAIISIGKYKKDLIRGAEFEDYSIRILGYRHFYSPKLKTGYAKNVIGAKQKGMDLFNQAVEFYKKGKERKAYYTLGRSFHYLADVGSPAHTKLIYHFGEDDFEVYTEDYIKRFRLKMKLKLVPPMTPNHCFNELAYQSYKMDYEKKTPTIHFFKNLIIKPKIKKSKELDKDSRKMLESCLVYTMALFRYFDLKTAGRSINKIFKPEIA